MKKYIAEVIGTFILVFFGTGVAVISNGNIIATSLAFGLAIVAAAYVIGGISGCHVNPAVSLSMVLTNKMSIKDFIGYVIAQVLGAFAGSFLLYLILKNTDMYLYISLGTNGYGELSLTNITLFGAFVTEVVLTFVFIYTILGVTNDESKSSIAPLVIGLTLTFVHLLGIGLTGTSVNPARSLAPAVLMGGLALKQVWVFLVAPFVGAAIASLVYRYLNGVQEVEELPKKVTRKKSK
jgi:aquaporin Z